MNQVSDMDRYSPERDGGCAVALGYDMDIPGDLSYLYDRDLGWRGRPNSKEVADYCHGHLNDDVSEYVRLLIGTAETFDARLQFFLQGNTLEDPVDLWADVVRRGHAE